jgi:hypothetical protein
MIYGMNHAQNVDMIQENPIKNLHVIVGNVEIKYIGITAIEL